MSGNLENSPALRHFPGCRPLSLGVAFLDALDLCLRAVTELRRADSESMMAGEAKI